MTLDTEARLARLEAKDAIRGLKARYARACDDGFDLGELEQLFTSDAVFDAGAFGRFDGREAILGYYSTVPDAISWGLHYIAGPTISVSDDAQTADGTWYFLQPATMADRAVWVMGTYRAPVPARGGWVALLTGRAQRRGRDAV